IRAKLHNMRLMQFPQALETVLRTLERIRDESAHRPCASREMLAQLEKVGAVAPNGPRAIEVNRPYLDRPKIDSVPTEGANKAERLAAVQTRVSVCTKCPHLASSRTQTVFGVGNPDAEIMFIGE